MLLQTIQNYIIEHQFDEAKNFLSELETNTAIVWKGWIIVHEHGLDDGEVYCLEQLKRDSDNPDLWSLLGWIQWEQCFPLKAMASFDRSLKMRWTVDAYLNFVGVACELGMYTEANSQVEMCEQYLNLDTLTQEKLDGYLLCKAILARQNGQSNEAVQLLNAIEHASPEVHLLRGHIYRDEFLFTQSMMAYQQGLDSFPMHPVLFESFQEVLRLLPAIPKGVHRLLADQPDSIDAFLKVRSYLEKIKADLMDRDAKSPEVMHLSAAIHGENTPMPPKGYVEELFDDYADRFECHLVEKLNYQVPSLVKAVVLNRYTHENMADSIWDLGCGTGLLGPFLKSVSRNLIGVDISEKMIERARLKGVYDALVKDDIIEFIHATKRCLPDLIIVADTLVYFGDLAPFFNAVSKHMSLTTELICTVEKLEDDTKEGFQLMPSGRYCHHLTFIQKATRQSGLQIVKHGDVLLRQGGGNWVDGLLLVVKRASQC